MLMAGFGGLLATVLFACLGILQAHARYENWNNEVVQCPIPGRKVAYLTFDDGWPSVKMAQFLHKRGIKATFFLVGGFASRLNMSVYQDVAKYGHEFGNHMFMHRNILQVGAKVSKYWISQAHNAITDATGCDIAAFRAPYGAIDRDMSNWIIDRMNYTIFRWSVDSMDWSNYSIESIAKHVAGFGTKPEGGDILLFHYWDDVTRLEKLLNLLQSKCPDCEWAPLSTCIQSGCLPPHVNGACHNFRCKKTTCGAPQAHASAQTCRPSNVGGNPTPANTSNPSGFLGLFPALVARMPSVAELALSHSL